MAGIRRPSDSSAEVQEAEKCDGLTTSPEAVHLGVRTSDIGLPAKAVINIDRLVAAMPNASVTGAILGPVGFRLELRNIDFAQIKQAQVGNG